MESAMGTGQMMITLAAIILLSLVILRVTTNFLSTEDVLMESKFGVLGISLATSMMEEATGKSFDEESDSGTILTLTDLAAIGPDAGEVYPFFDDFDDYDGLVKIDSSTPSAIYKIECDVNFVTPTNLDGYSATKTWHKKLQIKVSTESSKDTIEMETIYSYFFYR
jgi:hypothetical protein